VRRAVPFTFDMDAESPMHRCFRDTEPNGGRMSPPGAASALAPSRARAGPVWRSLLRGVVPAAAEQRAGGELPQVLARAGARRTPEGLASASVSTDEAASPAS
jgi:hypothetical protein